MASELKIKLISVNHYSTSFYSSMSNTLTILDLSGNFLDEIPFPAFKSLKVLEWLNLSK